MRAVEQPSARAVRGKRQFYERRTSAKPLEWVEEASVRGVYTLEPYQR